MTGLGTRVGDIKLVIRSLPSTCSRQLCNNMFSMQLIAAPKLRCLERSAQEILPWVPTWAMDKGFALVAVMMTAVFDS